jgi:hypothetical protein
MHRLANGLSIRKQQLLARSANRAAAAAAAATPVKAAQIQLQGLWEVICAVLLRQACLWSTPGPLTKQQGSGAPSPSSRVQHHNQHHLSWKQPS